MSFIKRHFIVITLILVVGGYAYWNYLRPVGVHESLDKESPHYVNDLYYSNGMAFSGMLGDAEQKMYMDILRDVKAFKVDSKLEGYDYGCDVFGDSCNIMLEEVIIALMLDHPELTQWGSYSTMQVGEYLKVEYRYMLKSKLWADLDNRKMLRKIYDVTNKVIDKSEIDKVKYIYEYLAKNEQMNFSASSKEQSAYNVLIGSKGTSASFAKAAQMLFQYLGLESYIVNGEYLGNHYWNIVRIDGEYYYFDATMGIGIVKEADNYYQGIGVNTEFLKNNYELMYPKVSGTKYLYENNTN